MPDQPLVPDLVRLRRLMSESHVELLLATDWVNAGYLAGHFLEYDLPQVALGNNWWGRESKGTLSRYENFVGIPLERGKEPFFIYSNEDGYTRQYEKCWIRECTEYGPNIDPIALVTRMIRERKLERGNIALPFDVSMRTMEGLRKALPDAVFHDGSGILQKLRMIKSAEEIRRLRRAAAATESACTAALDAAQEGMTEIELERIFRTELAQRGVYGAFNHVVFGEVPISIEGCSDLPRDSQGRIVYIMPTERKLERGDWIWLDIGGRYHCYLADIARHAKLGRLTRDEAKYYNKLKTVYEQVRDELRPGVRAADVYKKAKAMTREAGLRLAIDQAGHSLGIEIHEAPILVKNDDTILEESMVLSLELLFYDREFNGATNVEDTFLLTKTGNESLLGYSVPPPIREI